jgi:FAD/FMN-containing dehydrogenase
MKQFNQIVFNNDTYTLDVGAGLTWDDIYKFLNSDTPDYRNLGVVGGDPLVGVSGWLLGGGYSLLTNKHGLGVDNVVEFRVLTPSAIAQLQALPSDTTGVINANPQENPDLFMALKVRLSSPTTILWPCLSQIFLALREEGITTGSSHVLLCGLT